MTCPHGTVLTLWTPGANGSLNHIALPCNASHLPLDDRCCYYDPHGGSMVTSYADAEVETDARGCVVVK